MSYNPSYQQHQQPLSFPNPTQYSNPHQQNHPMAAPVNPSLPQDITRQGQASAAPAPYYGTTPPQQYGVTPPQQYGTSPNRPAQQQPQMYGSNPSQQPQMFGTTPPQQQYLTPDASHPSYPQPPQAGFPPQGFPPQGFPPQQPAFSEFPRSRPRARSDASYQSHKSHHSKHSRRASDEYGRPRKNSRVMSPRPSLGDTMVMMWSSVKGAFDTRK